MREADLSRRRGAKSGFPVPQQTTGREVAKPIGVAEAGGFVPALDRLTVRQISYRYLSEEERIDIADLRRGGSVSEESPPSLAGHHRPYRGSCAATAAATAPTGRLKLTAGQSTAEFVVIGGASTTTPSYAN